MKTRRAAKSRFRFLLLAGSLLSVSGLAESPSPAPTANPAVVHPVYTASRCDLWGTQPINDALKETRDAYQQIGASCDGILIIQDSSTIVKDTWQKCCRSADAYLKKKPYPNDSDERVHYRVSLALDVCDALDSHQSNYESKVCMMEMLFRIDDPRVHAIADECSPIGHHVGGDKGGRHKGGDEKAEAREPGPRPSGAAAWMASAAGGKKGGTSDLLLNDESFSSCQHKMLRAFLSAPAESKPPSMR